MGPQGERQRGPRGYQVRTAPPHFLAGGIQSSFRDTPHPRSSRLERWLYHRQEISGLK